MWKYLPKFKLCNPNLSLSEIGCARKALCFIEASCSLGTVWSSSGRARMWAQPTCTGGSSPPTNLAVPLAPQVSSPRRACMGSPWPICLGREAGQASLSPWRGGLISSFAFSWAGFQGEQMHRGRFQAWKQPLLRRACDRTKAGKSSCGPIAQGGTHTQLRFSIKSQSIFIVSVTLYRPVAQNVSICWKWIQHSHLIWNNSLYKEQYLGHA